jgi:hypothetical protein
MISDEEDIDPDFYDPRIELMSDTTKTSAAPMSWEFHQILLALRPQEKPGMSDKDVLREARLKGYPEITPMTYGRYEEEYKCSYSLMKNYSAKAKPQHLGFHRDSHHQLF